MTRIAIGFAFFLSTFLDKAWVDRASYAMTAVALAATRAGDTLGLGRVWRSLNPLPGWV